MRLRGGGFGIIALLIVAAVVMILAARQWKAVAPTAVDVLRPGEPGIMADPPDHGQPEASDAVRSGHLPDLQDMKAGTDAHSQAVQDALEQTE